MRRAAAMVARGYHLMAVGIVRHPKLDLWRTIQHLHPDQITPIIMATIIQTHLNPEESLPVPRRPLQHWLPLKLLRRVSETTDRPRGSNVYTSPKTITR